MNKRKALSFLGLAMKARKAVSGEFSVEKAVKTGKARVVIVADDASANTKKKFHNMCLYYQVPCYDFGSRTELGSAIGKEFRASIAILDENIGQAIEQQLNP